MHGSLSSHRVFAALAVFFLAFMAAPRHAWAQG